MFYEFDNIMKLLESLFKGHENNDNNIAQSSLLSSWHRREGMIKKSIIYQYQSWWTRSSHTLWGSAWVSRRWWWSPNRGWHLESPALYEHGKHISAYYLLYTPQTCRGEVRLPLIIRVNPNLCMERSGSVTTNSNCNIQLVFWMKVPASPPASGLFLLTP